MPPVSPMRQTTILLATSNPDKQQALQTILEGLSLSPVTPGHIGLEFNPEERGETHLEVARDKAIQWSRASSNLAIASDGGLVVPALGSQWESLYTRRFVGEEPADDQTRVHRLLEMMRPYQGADRRASWVEALAIANRGRLLASWEVNGAAGVIAQEPPESLPDDSRFWVFSIWEFPQFDKRYNDLSISQREALDDHWLNLRGLVRRYFQSHFVTPTS